MQLDSWFFLLIVALTILGITIGRIPHFRMNRATIAVVGATLLILSGAVSLEEAYAALDMNTIVLLFSMMVINVNLRISGFFKILSACIIRTAKSTGQLLLLIVISSGFLSGLFLNDTIVIMFTPLVLEITISLRRNPVPYLVALATSANVGSVATIVGNPQNMIIGMMSKIPFAEFSFNMAVPALTGLFIVAVIIKVLYRNEFSGQKIDPEIVIDSHVYVPLLRKTILALLLMVCAFFLGVPVTMAALGAAALLLLTRRIKPERVFKELDWGLLVFFSGLFVVTHVLEKYFLQNLTHFSLHTDTALAMAELSFIGTVLSNLISNVPAVLVLSPFVENLVNPQKFWLILAMSTTFAGNLTLLGSIANLIVAETAAKRGVQLKFNEYIKAGLPITLLTLICGTIWLIMIF